MTPIDQVYHRVRWDPGLDASRFVLGYDAHGPTPVEIPLLELVPGGDIPWHRVLYVAADGEVVWDRRTKLDRVGQTDAGRARRPRILREPLFTPRPPHRFDPDEERWVPTEPPALVTSPSAPLRVVTWNVLFDRHFTEHIHTERRVPLVLRELEAQDADVIALQEVEKPFLKALLAEPWVRARYVVSDAPAGRTVDPYGVVLLSRLPVLELATHALGRHKQVVAMVIAAGARPRVVMTCHLTSDHASRGAEKRRAQLTVLREMIDGAGDADALVLGDFNETGDLPSTALGARDVWAELEGDDAPTFDPEHNPLAALASLRGTALRLDRVLARVGADVKPSRIARIGTAPDETGLFPSDHYGLLAELALDVRPERRTYAGPVTHRTALAWVPPVDLWGPIQAVRREHDPRFDRWMPHVNVLYGFAPEHRFDEAAELAREALAEVAPFACRLVGVGSFRHRDEATLFYAPDGEGWSALAAAVLARFPGCDERHRGGFRPHLTLGRVALREADALAGRLAAELGEVRVPVGALALLSRRGEEPMEVRAWIELGTGELRWLDPPGDASAIDEPVERAEHAARITEAIVGAAPEAVRVEPIGSRRMGCATATSDVDLLWITDGAARAEDVAARIASALGDEVAGLRIVRGARAPGVKLRVGDLGVDVALVDGRDDVSPLLSGVTDNEAVRVAVAGGEATFVRLARVLKTWARAKGLDDAALGGLPGLAWAILVARALRELDPERDPLTQLFGALASWDPKVPWSLDGAARMEGDALTIPTPSPPHRNLASSFEASDVARLQELVYASWDGLQRGEPLERLLAPAPFAREHAAAAMVTVSVASADELEASVGWLRGRAMALRRAVRAAGASDARFATRAVLDEEKRRAFVLGLGRAPIDARTLAEASAAWIEEHLAWPERASGARVEVRWVEGGALPTIG